MSVTFLVPVTTTSSSLSLHTGRDVPATAVSSLAAWACRLADMKIAAYNAAHGIFISLDIFNFLIPICYSGAKILKLIRKHSQKKPLVVVILIAIIMVAAAVGIAKAIAPRSYNPQKSEPYECGIPTRGKSWMQFKVGYYLFAILFLMFDVETVFLFAWAVVVQDLGIYGLTSVLFFLLVLVLGLAYAWRKGALEWK